MKVLFDTRAWGSGFPPNRLLFIGDSFASLLNCVSSVHVVVVASVAGHPDSLTTYGLPLKRGEP